MSLVLRLGSNCEDSLQSEPESFDDKGVDVLLAIGTLGVPRFDMFAVQNARELCRMVFVYQRPDWADEPGLGRIVESGHRVPGSLSINHHTVLNALVYVIGQYLAHVTQIHDKCLRNRLYSEPLTILSDLQSRNIILEEQCDDSHV